MGYIDMTLWWEGWELYNKYTDKNYSFVDCISFSYMKRENIVNAFAFDKHFKQMGFFLIK